MAIASIFKRQSEPAPIQRFGPGLSDFTQTYKVSDLTLLEFAVLTKYGHLEIHCATQDCYWPTRACSSDRRGLYPCESISCIFHMSAF